MSLLWVILGTFLQLALTGMLFMLAAFTGGGYAGGGLSKTQRKILDLSMFALPFLALASAGIVIYEYVNDASSNAYWWYSMPIVGAVLYWFYTKTL